MHKKHILTSLFTIWLFVPVVGYAVQIGDGPFEAQPGYYWHYDGSVRFWYLVPCLPADIPTVSASSVFVDT